ncbi:MAG: hypothetical protein GC164_13105 [Phycisphaera sp.]|nr:hypothetical protein [Phycisphaera sp.]
MSRSNSLATVGQPGSLGTAARWVLAAVAVNALWRCVRYGVNFPLWGDEAFVAMSLLTHDVRSMFGALDHAQVVPVGFMLAELAVTKWLGLSEYVLRLIPFIAGLLSLVLYWRLAVKMLPRYGALLAVAVFAASYYPVRHAAEVKPYSVDMLAALVMTHIAWGLWRRPDRWGLWGLLAPVLGASVWVSYPAAFVGGGLVVALGMRAMRVQRRAAWTALACALVLGLSFIAMWKISGADQSQSAKGVSQLPQWVRAFPGIEKPWGLPLRWFIDTHTGNFMAYPFGGKNFGSTGTFILVIVGILRMWRHRRGVLAVLLCPLPVMFVAAALHKYPYGDSARIGQHVAPAICLLAGVGLLVLLQYLLGKPRKVATAARVTVALLLILALAQMARDLSVPYKFSADVGARRVIGELARRASHDDLLVLYANAGTEGSDLFLHYGSGSGVRNRFYVRRNAPCPVIDAVLPTNLPAVAGGVWVISWQGGDAAPRTEDVLEAYVRTLVPTLGEPTVEHHDLGGRGEILTVHRFGQRTE